MIRLSYRPQLLIALLLVGATAFAATRHWQSGKLLDTEQQKVTDGSTAHYNTDSQKNSKNGKTNYSQNTTATTTDNTDTYEVYTIQTPEKTYIAREKLLFPWSKPANVTVGTELKYAIEGRRLIILDEDQKEHKASIVKTSLNPAD
ncbi:MAG TPA: hypothetical protein VGU67_08190 [Edaphobacter sp.]|nr:hypothetical protein [Edaphobacter sp.]